MRTARAPSHAGAVDTDVFAFALAVPILSVHSYTARVRRNPQTAVPISLLFLLSIVLTTLTGEMDGVVQFWGTFHVTKALVAAALLAVLTFAGSNLWVVSHARP